MIKFTVLALFVAAALAIPAPELPSAAYESPEPVYGPPETEYGPPDEGSESTTPSGSEVTTPEPCEEGLIRDPLGDCVKPEVIRDLYVFQEPVDEVSTDKPYLPPPKVKLNLVVIKTDDGGEGEEPIIIPPPQEKTLVLVLSKKGDNERQIIEIPAPQGQKPEVFFVDYAEGDNPLLPGQIYLQDALKYAAGTESETTTAAGGYEESEGTDGSESEPPSEPPYTPYFF